MSKTLTQQLKEVKEELDVYRRERSEWSDKLRVADDMIVEHDAAKAKVLELTTKLAASESAKESYRTSSNGYNQELNQLHEVLDALPGSIPKRAEESYTDRSVLTRLAAWLGSTK
jgi:chromosome segregation ATPase